MLILLCDLLSINRLINQLDTARIRWNADYYFDLSKHIDGGKCPFDRA